ncbi:imidazole glycerol phosphate synthase subunit HisH [candidate division KSB1 bacterium]|nr:imidazole glycerol phosphate synthase subunit HisH [candidate division KSB1 bacterium]
MIAVIDYRMGNLRSVYKCLVRLGQDVKICQKPGEVEKADKIILPGVGNFFCGMQQLRETDMIGALNHKVHHDKVPILGICLGMQLLTEHSEEGNVAGLGWVAAETKRFVFDESSSRFKIPHMGWNTLQIYRAGRLFKDLDPAAIFYFVHAYYVTCRSREDIVATTEYGNTFVSSFEKENIFGTQFHPEKSHAYGLQILKNFVEL